MEKSCQPLFPCDAEACDHLPCLPGHEPNCGQEVAWFLGASWPFSGTELCGRSWQFGTGFRNQPGPVLEHLGRLLSGGS
eukprot:679244-Heterocapsa_arctica.AAC.1